MTKRFFGDAGEQIAGANYYYTRDHLGSIRELTDSTGAVRARYDYDPYGRQTKVSGDLDADFGFTGYYRHQTSGLNLTKYRAYDPELGRWISRDPLGQRGGLNLYQYVGNNPVNWFDPLGLFPLGDPNSAAAWSVNHTKPTGVSPSQAVGFMVEGILKEVEYTLALFFIVEAVTGAFDSGKDSCPDKSPKPPGWNDQWEKRPNTDGNDRWHDPDGGEWRRHEPDKWHSEPHWDYNPWDRWSSPWRNLDDNGNPWHNPSLPGQNGDGI